MAAKKYSAEDQKKLVTDKLADLRAKGIDVRQVRSLIPGGAVEAVKQIQKDISYSRDQSQIQTESNRRKMLERGKQ